MLDGAQHRKAELEMRQEPLGLHGQAGIGEIGDHALEIRPHEARQHEAVVQAVPQRTSGCR